MNQPPMSRLRKRNAEEVVLEALSDTRVVLIAGARQVGKSTLASTVLANHEGLRELTLDDPATLASAQADPITFVRQTPGGTLIIDEIQRAPGLFVAIKTV